MKKYVMPDGQKFNYKEDKNTIYHCHDLIEVKCKNLLRKKNFKKLCKQLKTIIQNPKKSLEYEFINGEAPPTLPKEYEYVELFIHNNSIHGNCESAVKIETKKEFKNRMKKMKNKMIKNAKSIIENSN